MPGSETLTVTGPRSEILITAGKREFSLCQNFTMGQVTKQKLIFSQSSTTGYAKQYTKMEN